MSEFSELLYTLVHEHQANVAQIAKACTIHAPTLHQYMNGKRALHSEEELERIMAALQLSPSERERLTEAFLVLQLGSERYYERRRVARFIQSLPEIEHQREAVLSTIESAATFECNGEFASLHGELEVNAAFFSILNDACRKNEEICILLQPEDSQLLNAFRLLGAYPTQSHIRHIFCLESGRNVGELTNIERAYYIVHYSAAVQHYRPLYYYGHPEECFGASTLLPGLLLTGSAALCLSHDGSSAAYLRNSSALAYLLEQFERIETLCKPLLVYQQTPLEIANRQAEYYRTFPNKAKLIPGGLCAAAFCTPEIFRTYLNPKLPSYDTILNQLIGSAQNVYQTKRSGSTSIILNMDSFRSFAQSGLIVGYPEQFIAKPLAKADRRLLLERMLQASEEGWYHMHFLHGCTYPVKRHWEIGLLDENIFVVRLCSNYLNRELFFREAGLCRIFQDYFDALVSGKYAMSVQKTNEALRQIIETYLN